MARSTRRDRPGPESEGGRVVLALILGLALLAGGGYVAAYAAAGGKVPVGTTVAGVDIGGRQPSRAMEILRAGLADRADRPFTVVINGRTRQVRPADVGLGIDYAASVRKASAERSWRPSRLWRYFTGGSTFTPVVTLDQNRLATLLERLDASDGRTPADGSVTFRNGTFTVRPPRPGLTVDPRAAGTAFWNAYLSDDPSVQLRMTATSPTIDAAAIHRFVKRFANRAMAAGVELRFGSAHVHLSPAVYGDLLGARRVGHELHPTVRARALARTAKAGLVGAPIDRPTPATVALVHGHPQVVSARPGVTFKPRDIGSALLRAITSRDRTARVHATVAKASFTNADARALGIRQQVSSSTVRLPKNAGGVRLTDIVDRLDGVVLKPGRTLSLRGVLGGATPTGTPGDRLATALFNAAWTGGLRITAHAVEPSYRGGAPIGRDASLRDGQDLAFVDNTRYGVLVSVAITPGSGSHHGSLKVTLWSTPRWKVTSSHGPRTNVVPATRRVVRTQHCTPRKGADGFDVTVTRSFAMNGHVDHTSSYTVSYAPVDSVVCRSKHHHGHGDGLIR